MKWCTNFSILLNAIGILLISILDIFLQGMQADLDGNEERKRALLRSNEPADLIKFEQGIRLLDDGGKWH